MYAWWNTSSGRQGSLDGQVRVGSDGIGIFYGDLDCSMTLEFLGLGDANQISWGYLLHNGQHFMRDAWWMLFFPTFGLCSLVFALNVVGDALDRALDPKSRIERFDKPA